MNKPTFEIRSAKSADLPAMHDVREEAFAPIFASFRAMIDPSSAQAIYEGAENAQGDYLDSIWPPTAARPILVATVANDVIGFCAYAMDMAKKLGTIDLNAVHPSHAGQGIGTALYQRALDDMTAQGMQAAQVGTGGDPSHAPARRAYAKVGLKNSIPSILLCKAL